MHAPDMDPRRVCNKCRLRYWADDGACPHCGADLWESQPPTWIVASAEKIEQQKSQVEGGR